MNLLAKPAFTLQNICQKVDYMVIRELGENSVGTFGQKNGKKCNQTQIIIFVREYNVSKRYSVIVTRIKLNHGKFSAHFYKINIVNSDKCSSTMAR